MRIEGQRVHATFLRRVNRFAVDVKHLDQVIRAHLANSGRLSELLAPGERVLLVARPSPTRKTRYDLALVRHHGPWMSVDARKPGPLLAEAIAEHRLLEFAEYRVARTEPASPKAKAGGTPKRARAVRGRFDLLLEGPRGPCYVETKSVTLVEEGRALFPDARTQRGARHMRELADLAERGTEAAAVFVVQRADVREFAPHWQSDPHFCWELVAARRAGVRVLACRCKVTPYEVTIIDTIPMVLV